MVEFSNDVDILKYEPILFGELHLPWQIRASGTGAALTGTTLTASDVDFESAGVSPGYVAYLHSTDGSLDGTYEIVSVDSATQLTVSVLRSDAADSPIAPPAADEIAYRISTFGPQAGEAAFQITGYFGVQPGDPTSEIAVDDIVDAEGLRRASAFSQQCVSALSAIIGSAVASDKSMAGRSMTSVCPPALPMVVTWPWTFRVFASKLMRSLPWPARATGVS